MDRYQEFVLEKIGKGFKSEKIDEPLTDLDIKRLKSQGDIYKTLPQAEWDEWSRKTHWALQVIFLSETERVTNIEKFNEWRKKFITVVLNALNKSKDELIVIDNAAAHFVQNDLLRYIIEEVGYESLSEDEKQLAAVFKVGVRPGKRGSGCFGVILILLFCTIGIFLFQ